MFASIISSVDIRTSTSRGMFGGAISSVETILYFTNLYIEFLKVSYERHVRNQDVYSTVRSGKGQGYRRYPSLNTLHAAGCIMPSRAVNDFSFVVQGFRTNEVANIVCATGGVHTLTSCTHIFPVAHCTVA